MMIFTHILLFILSFSSLHFFTYSIPASSTSQSIQVQLEVSFDSGSSWHIHDKPNPSPPQHAYMRVAHTSTPMIRVPACALSSSSLQVDIWQDDNTSTPFALSWHSSSCMDPGTDSDPDIDTENKISTTIRNIHRGEPQWLNFVMHEHQIDMEKEAGDDGDKDKKTEEEKKKKKKGVFSTYLPYILVFVAIALAQGIRKGMAELQDEMNREEEQREMNQLRRAQQPQVQQQQQQPMNIVAPRNRSAVRARRKGSRSSAK